MKPRHFVLVAIGIAAVAYGIEAERSLAPFRKVTSRGGESCRKVEVPDLAGAEDMEFDHANNTVWIAAAHRLRDPSFRPDSGAIFRWKLDSDAAPVRVPIEGLPAPLRPHGLGLFISPAGERRLFVVQHGESGESIEIFRLDGSVLRHVRSVRDPQLISLNDVAPVGLESFYVTNDHGRPPRFGHVLEDFALLSNASVVYFDGTVAKVVAPGLRYANGILIDRGGRFVLVAETTARRMAIFERQADGGLRLLSRTALGTAPDNFAQDENGEFMFAAHPSSLQFLRHATDETRHSASQVARFRLSADGTPTPPETIWLDDGSLLSASSVAAAHGAYWLIGAVYDKGVLLCRR